MADYLLNACKITTLALDYGSAPRRRPGEQSLLGLPTPVVYAHRLSLLSPLAKANPLALYCPIDTDRPL